MASGVLLGGHVVVGDRANLGLGTVVHQRRVIGPDAMVGMGSVVTRDLPPFARAFGTPARVHGVNAVGMGRQGISTADVAALAELYGAGRDVVAHWPPAASLAPALAWWRRHATAG
jgi:UDP-N-acetylglucosamine acyltransferase